MTTNKTRFDAVVLAAGGSRRMGEPKQLINIKGETLLSTTIAAVRSADCFGEIAVVIGAHAQLVKNAGEEGDVVWLENEQWESGLSSSVRLGLDYFQHQKPETTGVLFCLSDQPNISGAALRSIVEGAISSPEAEMVASRYDGHYGAPCLLRRPGFRYGKILAGDVGLRPLFQRLPPSKLVAVDLPELSIDLDTAADVESYRNRPG